MRTFKDYNIILATIFNWVILVVKKTLLKIDLSIAMNNILFQLFLRTANVDLPEHVSRFSKLSLHELRCKILGIPLHGVLETLVF